MINVKEWTLLQEQRERLEPELAIGDTWEDVETFVQWAITVDLEKRSSLDAVIWGETDALAGYRPTLNILSYSPDATLIITGGVYGREELIGDIGSIDMFQKFLYKLTAVGMDENEVKEKVILDSFSRHTGHQRQLLPGILKGIGAQSAGVAIPMYHMPRFLLSVGRGLKDEGSKARLIPFAYGLPEKPHIKKAPVDKDRNFTYEELFALPPQESRVQDGVKSLDCGEIDKILGYQSPEENQCLTFREAIEFFNI